MRLAGIAILSLCLPFTGCSGPGSSSGTISTYAGSGTGGSVVNGASATSVGLAVFGVALDASGNLYIAGNSGNAVYKVTTAGIISTFAGSGKLGYSGDGGAATSAELRIPDGVAVDGSGNVYIADTGNSCIRKVTPAGIISTYAGTGVGGYSGDGGAATSARMIDPESVAVDSSGNLYIADSQGERIRKVTAATGIISTVAGDGTVGFSGDGGAATSSELSEPNGLAVDSSGSLYIADTYNFRIRKVTPGGIISTVAGNGQPGSSSSVGDGGAATSAELTVPRGIAVDSSGNLYIADVNEYRVRKVTTAGIITTVAGDGTGGFSGDGGPATSAELLGPYGVAVDSSGNLYIADLGNGRVRKVTY